MIYTVTFSPAIDYAMRLSKLDVGRINRSSEAVFRAGGKGINVSKVLKALGEESVACLFAGGFTGEYIVRELAHDGIAVYAIETEECSRINVKLRHGGETDINAVSKPLADGCVEQLTAFLKRADRGDTVVIAGSCNASEKAFCGLLGAIKESGARLAIDLCGEKLQAALKFHPFLIKPNFEELRELSMRLKCGETDPLRCAKRALSESAENVLLSLGGEGCLFVNRQKEIKVPAPGGVVIDTVGAGDSMLAGFLCGLRRYDGAIERALQLSVACGSATAFSDGLAKKEDILETLGKIGGTF